MHGKMWEFEVIEIFLKYVSNSLWTSLSKAQTACFSPWILLKVKVSGQLQWIRTNPVELCGKHLCFSLFAGWKIKKGLRASFSSVLSNEIIMLSLTKINHKEKEIGLEVNNYSLNFKYVDYPEWSEHKWFVFFFFFHWEK